MLANTLITGITGTGRTVYFADSILEAIQADTLVIVFDAYGDLVESIVASVPEDKLPHTAYITVGKSDFPIGLNIFEATTEQDKREVCNTVIGLMYDLFDPNRTGIIGPRFEHAVRNAILTILSDENVTFFELIRCLLDQDYVRKILPKVKDPIVANYWTKQIAQTNDFHKSEVLDYIVSKFDKFTTDTKVRNIIGQSKSTIHWETLLSEKKIVLFDFSGFVDEPDSLFIICSILFNKLTNFLKRRENKQKEHCAIFVDEASFWSPSPLQYLLSNGRRYGLSLHITTQRLVEVNMLLQKELLRIEAVTSFRLSTEDAKLVASQLHSNITVDELCMLPKFHAFVKKNQDGNPQKAEEIDFPKPEIQKPLRSAEEVKKLKEELGKPYYRTRSEIEEEIGSF